MTSRRRKKPEKKKAAKPRRRRQIRVIRRWQPDVHGSTQDGPQPDLLLCSKCRANVAYSPCRCVLTEKERKSYHPEDWTGSLGNWHGVPLFTMWTCPSCKKASKQTKWKFWKHECDCRWCEIQGEEFTACPICKREISEDRSYRLLGAMTKEIPEANWKRRYKWPKKNEYENGPKPKTRNMMLEIYSDLKGSWHG